MGCTGRRYRRGPSRSPAAASATFPAVAADLPPDLELAPLDGKPHSLRGWLTTFHLAAVALDPFTNESAWILPTATRILREYDQANCRVSLVVTCTTEEARMFLGPYADEFLVFADPERTIVKGMGLERLPALIHIRQDLSVAGVAEGWDPAEWRRVTDTLSRAVGWHRPNIPAPRDPAAFEGTPALG
jgi:hypothetical protein